MRRYFSFQICETCKGYGTSTGPKSVLSHRFACRTSGERRSGTRLVINCAHSAHRSIWHIIINDRRVEGKLGSTDHDFYETYITTSMGRVYDVEPCDGSNMGACGLLRDTVRLASRHFLVPEKLITLQVLRALERR